MGIMVYSLLWVMQDSYHQPYGSGLGFAGSVWAFLAGNSDVAFRILAVQLHGEL